MTQAFDVIIMGGGHNGLVAANYLAKAGKRVVVLEANATLGGAVQSERVFPDFDARLSRYSYLVSLLPDQIIEDLGLQFRTQSRKVSSYTPYQRNNKHKGLLVEREWGAATEASFRDLTGSEKAGRQWREFYSEVGAVMSRLAPTLLQPLPTRSELKKLAADDALWRALMEVPLGFELEKRFDDDILKGIILTDGLVGTYSSAFDLQSNICFLYHLIGNGLGEWKVPLGGMGELVSELESKARERGVVIEVESRVDEIEGDDTSVKVRTGKGNHFSADYLLVGSSVQELHRLMNWEPIKSLDGSQVKINMLVERLPRLASGDDSSQAFAGTFHINEGFSEFESVFQQTKAQTHPSVLPAEIYCHTLTDATILSPELAQKGYHTLTLFGFHTPASLFDNGNDSERARYQKLALEGLNNYLAEPIEDVLARSHDGSLAIEVKTPLDLESELGLPRGNIFQRDLQFPFKEDGDETLWGVETAHPRIFLCGASAKRGGGVSGIPGHNAAMAVLHGK